MLKLSAKGVSDQLSDASSLIYVLPLQPFRIYHDGFLALSNYNERVNSTGWKGAQTMHAYKSRLTRREREVLRLIASGQTDRKIAETLIISPRTVNRHVCNIFGKLEVPSRAAAAVHAVRSGLIEV